MCTVMHTHYTLHVTAPSVVVLQRTDLYVHMIAYIRRILYGIVEIHPYVQYTAAYMRAV